MRFVNRNDVPAPEVLVSETAKGPTETAKAVKFYTEWLALSGPKEPVSFPFGAYKDNSIKIALEKLFLGKCAYCEGYYLSLQPVDIEHWRPKGAVDIEGGDQRKYGYFWLAASWQNLLPSCIDCNRARKHKDYIEDKVITIGKKNQFPVVDETKRATSPGSDDSESPLLIDPCKDDPSQHLVFHPEGYVSPRIGENGKPSPKGIASIRVYALNRTELVQDRRTRALLIERRMQSIQSLGKLSQMVSDDEDKLFLVEELLAREVKELREFHEPGAAFSALARTMIDPFINSLQN